MKSPQRKLRDASELIAIAGVTAGELVCCSVYGAGLAMSIHLRPKALLRVYQLLGVSRRKVELRVDEQGNLHASFSARGAEWISCVLADSEDGRRWRAALATGGSRAIASSPVLALPGPQVTESQP